MKPHTLNSFMSEFSSLLPVFQLFRQFIIILPPNSFSLLLSLYLARQRIIFRFRIQSITRSLLLFSSPFTSVFLLLFVILVPFGVLFPSPFSLREFFSRFPSFDPSSLAKLLFEATGLASRPRKCRCGRASAAGGKGGGGRKRREQKCC